VDSLMTATGSDVVVSLALKSRPRVIGIPSEPK
jgi:hypothetical protein